MNSPNIAIVSGEMNNLKRVRNLFKPEEFNFNLIRSLEHVVDVIDDDEFFDAILIFTEAIKKDQETRPGKNQNYSQQTSRYSTFIDGRFQRYGIGY